MGISKKGSGWILDQMLKVPEAAKILNVSKSTVYKLMQTGELRHVRIRGSRRIKISDLKTYIDEGVSG